MRFARLLVSPLCLIPIGVRYSGLPAHDAPALIAVTAVGVSPNNVVGGKNVTLSVMLDADAPFGGSVVNLSYSALSVFTTAPKSVAVPHGQKLASVTVVTKPTAATAAVTITATLGSSSAQTTLTVRQPQIATIALSLSTITGGQKSTLVLTLDGPAPAGGFTPQIIFSPSSLGVIPLVQRTCPAGIPCNSGVLQKQDSTIAADSTGLRIFVSGVPVRDPRTVNLTASLGVPKSVSLQILPPPVTVKFRANCDHGTDIPSSAAAQAIGVQVSTNHGVSANGAYVSLTSSPNLGLPATLELAQVNPPNEHYECVPITLPAFSQKTSVRVTAMSGPTPYIGTLGVVPLGITQLSLSHALITSGLSASGRVTLNGFAPANGLVVQLSSSDKTIANVPPTVTIPSGLIFEGFSFTPVFPGGTADTVVSAIITATFAGQSHKDTILVRRP